MTSFIETNFFTSVWQPLVAFHPLADGSLAEIIESKKNRVVKGLFKQSYYH